MPISPASGSGTAGASPRASPITLLGLADFAIVQSYLSITAKWGIDALDALTWLFTDGPWLPPATAPPIAPQWTTGPHRVRCQAPQSADNSRASAMDARLKLNSYRILAILRPLR